MASVASMEMAQHGAYDVVVGKAQFSQRALSVHASVVGKVNAKTRSSRSSASGRS